MPHVRFPGNKNVNSRLKQENALNWRAVCDIIKTQAVETADVSAVWPACQSEAQEKNIMVEVVAALIISEGRFLICQRPAHKTRGLLWEFVGGKVENGETKEKALVRECREELAVTVSVGDEFTDVIHEYPDITVHLTVYRASIAEGAPLKLEHNDIRWITPGEIDNYEFCPADEVILKKITEVYKQTVCHILPH